MKALFLNLCFRGMSIHYHGGLSERMQPQLVPKREMRHLLGSGLSPHREYRPHAEMASPNERDLRSPSEVSDNRFLANARGTIGVPPPHPPVYFAPSPGRAEGLVWLAVNLPPLYGPDGAYIEGGGGALSPDDAKWARESVRVLPLCPPPSKDEIARAMAEVEHGIGYLPCKASLSSYYSSKR